MRRLEEFAQRHRGRLEAMPLRRARGRGLLAGAERALLRILEFVEETRPGQALEQLAAARGGGHGHSPGGAAPADAHG
ncbi:hypothetical protein OG229_36410 [Streptomyces platensis]|uniref:hypothetical protein n=1 Tax=Streptomyces platensis TaxID=58346 RepID=UPI002E142F12|nr:hypothetical protein OG229_36410 [Streptomyces platensis]